MKKIDAKLNRHYFHSKMKYNAVLFFVACNVYQDGTASPATLQQIQKLGHTLGVLKL